MADNDIDISLRLANIAEIKTQLAELTSINLKFKGLDQLDFLRQWSTSGINIKINFNFGDQLKTLQDLQNKGIALKNASTGSTATSNAPNLDNVIAKVARDIANESAVAMRKYQDEVYSKQIASREARVNSGFVPFDKAEFQRRTQAPKLPYGYLDLEQQKLPYGYLDLAPQPRSTNDLIRRQSLQAEQVIANSQLNGQFNKIYPNLSARGAAGVAANTEEYGPFLNASNVKALESQASRGLNPAQISQNRLNSNITKANKQLSDSVLEYYTNKEGFNEKREELASSLGVNKDKLVNKPKNFDTGRLQNKDVITALAFTGLFGGPLNVAGGALGASTIGGPEGVLIGTTVVDAAKKSFEQLFNTLREASEAATEFERSIAAITGVIGSTTNVSVGGEQLSGANAYIANKSVATSLATSARQALIPLGISGEAESSLANAFISARAGQGFLPSADTTKTVLERFGAFTQTAGSDIQSTRLFKDFTDILTGSPQAKSTALGARLKNITPELFSGKTLNDEELVKATEPLKQYVEAIKNGNDFIQQRIRTEGELKNLQLALGESLNQALVPGMKALANALDSPKLIDNLERLGTAFGTIASVSIEGILQLGDSLHDIAVEFQDLATASSNLSQNLSPLDVIKRYYKDATGETATENQEKTNDTELAKLQARQKAKGQTVSNLNGDTLTSSKKITNVANDEAAFKTVLTNLGFSDKDLDKLLTTPENNPFYKLYAGQEALSKVTGPSPGDIGKRTNFALHEILSGQQGVLQERLKGVDTGTIEGQIQANGLTRASLANQAKTEKQVIGNLEFEKAFESLGSKKYFEIVKQLEAEEAKLAEIRAQETKNVRELVEVQIKRVDLKRSGIDQTNFAGQQENLTGIVQGNAEKIRLLTGLPGEENAARIRELKTGAKNAYEDLQQNKLGELSEKFNYFDSLHKLGNTFADLADKGAELAESMTKAKEALTDFDDDKHLRELGRQGEFLAQADKVQASANAVDAAGGVGIAHLPFGINSSLVKGNASFDPLARARFEQDLATEQSDSFARKNDVFRFGEEEDFTKAGINRGIGKIGREQDNIPFERQAAQLNFFQQSLALARKLEKDKSPFANAVRSGLQAQLKNLDAIVGGNGTGLDINTFLGKESPGLTSLTSSFLTGGTAPVKGLPVSGAGDLDTSKLPSVITKNKQQFLKDIQTVYKGEIPEKLRALLAKAGVSLEGVDYLKNDNIVKAGYSGEAGQYNTKSGLISFAEFQDKNHKELTGNDLRQLVGHETGHAVDYKLLDHFSANPEFIKALLKDSKKLTPSQRKDFKYDLESVDKDHPAYQEAFADIFGDLTSKSGEGTAKAFPTAAKLVKDRLASIIGPSSADAKNVGQTLTKQQQDQQKQLSDAVKEISKDDRSLADLSKADLADAVNIGTSLALNSHFA